MINKHKLPKPLFLLIGVISFLVFCLPSCTGDGDQTPTKRTTTEPYTKTSEAITSLTTGVISSYPVPTTKTSIEPVKMPPDMTGRISKMLKVVPGVPEATRSQVWFIDYAAWDETLGINRNDYRNAEGETTIESENIYVSDLILSPFKNSDTTRLSWYPWLGFTPFISGMGSGQNIYSNRDLLKMPIRTKNIGYGPLDVDQSIVSAVMYQGLPGYYEAIKGSFNTAEIIRTISGGQYSLGYKCPIISASNGVDIYSWDGESKAERTLESPIFDEYGRGRTLAVQPFDIFGAVQEGRIDNMIEASLGLIDSLVDDPRYQEMADKLERMSSISAIMTDVILTPDYWSYYAEDSMRKGFDEIFHQSTLSAPVMGPYIAFASGLSVDEQGIFVSLVLLYSSPELAKKDINTLENRLLNGVNSTNDKWEKEVTFSEIWSDGNTLCAKLYGNVTSYWDCFVTQEPLLVRGN